MKTLHALLSAIILLYSVEKGICGAIDLKTEEIEDEAVMMAKGSIFDKLFDTLISGYETVSQILHDMLEKEDDQGILSSIYEKLKEELSKLKDCILGGKPVVAEEAEAARRAVERLIQEHKRIHADSKTIIEGAVESVKNARLVRKIVNEGPDVIRHRIYEIDRALKEHVFDGVTRRVDLAENDVSNVEDTFRSSVDFLQEQGVKLTDQEKEVLDGILKRVHEGLMHDKEHLKEHLK